MFAVAVSMAVLKLGDFSGAGPLFLKTAPTEPAPDPIKRLLAGTLSGFSVGKVEASALTG
jgi:hypothetical protein